MIVFYVPRMTVDFNFVFSKGDSLEHDELPLISDIKEKEIVCVIDVLVLVGVNFFIKHSKVDVVSREIAEKQGTHW